MLELFLKIFSISIFLLKYFAYLSVSNAIAAEGKHKFMVKLFTMDLKKGFLICSNSESKSDILLFVFLLKHPSCTSAIFCLYPFYCDPFSFAHQ